MFLIFPGTSNSDQSDPYEDSGSEYVPSEEEGGVNEAIETSSEETQEEETTEFKPKNVFVVNKIGAEL